MYGNRILEDILQCSYPPNHRDYITGAIMELQGISKSAQFFKVNRKIEYTSETILCSKFNISVTLKDKLYDIPTIIYLGKNFPIDPPEIYLERTSKELTVNPKNLDVDPNSLKIYVNSQKLWVPFKSKLTSVINEIIYSFSMNFPIYKKSTQPPQNTGFQQPTNYIPPNQTTYQNPSQQFTNPNIYPGQGQYSNVGQNQYSNVSQFQGQNPYQSGGQYQPGNFNYPGSMYNPNTGQYPYQNPNVGVVPSVNYPGFSNQQFNTYQQTSQQISPVLSDEDLKRNLIEELKHSLKQKIQEEIKSNNNFEEKFRKFKEEITTQNQVFKNFVERKDDILIALKQQIGFIDEDIKTLGLIVSYEKDTEMTPNNFDSFIRTSNKKLIEVVCVEATVEELITLTKRIVEKGCIPLQDAIKFIRGISRELFKLKYFRDKLIRVSK